MPRSTASIQILLLLLIGTCSAQNPSGATSDSKGSPPNTIGAQNPPSNYILGPGDQITLLVADMDEIGGKDRPFRVGLSGDLDLPIVGRVQAGGLTVDQLQAEIADRLKRVLQKPDVVVSITEFHSQPVSVLGQVNTPGVIQLEGHKTLFELLSQAGGLRQEAGNTIKITRDRRWGQLPLSDAYDDPTGKYSSGSVKVRDIMTGNHPEENIVVKPGDVITVPKGELIYVLGSVHKPGGFVLGESDSMSALEAVSLAEGLEYEAKAQQARLIRPIPGTSNFSEIPVDLKKLLAGKTPDVQMKPNDVLFVPESGVKSFAQHTAASVATAAAGAAVYHY